MKEIRMKDRIGILKDRMNIAKFLITGLVILLLGYWMYYYGINTIPAYTDAPWSWEDTGITFSETQTYLNQDYGNRYFGFYVKATNTSDQTITRLEGYYRLFNQWYPFEVETEIEPSETRRIQIYYQEPLLLDQKTNEQITSEEIKLSLTKAFTENGSTQEKHRFGRYKFLLALLIFYLIEFILFLLYTGFEMPAVFECVFFAILVPGLILPFFIQYIVRKPPTIAGYDANSQNYDD